jgi:Calcineurin-like phosphoesterase
LPERGLPEPELPEPELPEPGFHEPGFHEPGLPEPGRPERQPSEQETPQRPTLFAGDPHRNFSPILRACLAHPPGTLILLGDCDCPAPLAHLLAPAVERGWDVRWILGNHDTETEAAYDNLTTHPGGFGLHVISVNGLRIAGLPGIFKPRVWHPHEGPPSYFSRTAFQAALRPHEPWRGGLPLFHRDTIFPEDFDSLAAQQCDILVTHEAPSSHPHGFAIIDTLAQACGARLIVHGHHHQSYQAVLANGIAVRGLGLAEPWLLDFPDPPPHHP